MPLASITYCAFGADTAYAAIIWGRLSVGRAFATASNDPKRGLKASLRALYKQIHPDLFQLRPEAKADNEKSFKLLQEYLEQAKAQNMHSISRSAFKFIFHLHDLSEGSGLRKVEVTLPPPSPAPHYRSGVPFTTVLSRDTRTALSRLLSACGLEAGEEDVSDVEVQAGQERSRHLLLFLAEVQEVVRQAEAAGVDPEVQAAHMRGAIRLSYQLIVGFGSEVEPPRKLELIQQLIGALQMAGDAVEELRGLHVLLGGQQYDVDARGALWLPFDATADQWADFLAGVDVDHARRQAETAAALARLEGHVAQALGIDALFTVPHAAMDPRYRELLEALAARAAKNGGPLVGGTLWGVALLVQPPAGTLQGRAGSATACSVDKQRGLILVALDAGADTIWHFMEKEGPAVAAAAATAAQHRQQLEELVATVRQRLRLRRLVGGDGVTAEQLRLCCLQLQRHAAALLPLMEGSSVRVARANRVAKGSTWVDVAWDFQL